MEAFCIFINMKYVRRYIDRANSVLDNLDEVANQAIEENLDVIYHLIKEEQLGQGLDYRGKVVGVYKPSTYEDYVMDPYQLPPRKPKTPFEPYNFEWSGKLFDGIYVKLNNDQSFNIETKARQTLIILEQKYKTNLLTLMKPHMSQFIQNILMPQIYKFALNQIFGKFF